MCHVAAGPQRKVAGEVKRSYVITAEMQWVVLLRITKSCKRTDSDTSTIPK